MKKITKVISAGIAAATAIGAGLVLVKKYAEHKAEMEFQDYENQNLNNYNADEDIKDVVHPNEPENEEQDNCECKEHNDESTMTTCECHCTESSEEHNCENCKDTVSEKNETVSEKNEEDTNSSESENTAVELNVDPDKDAKVDANIVEEDIEIHESVPNKEEKEVKPTRRGRKPTAKK